MGKIKYIEDIRNFFKKNPVVDINSLKKFISYNKGNEDYVYLLINKMIKKNEIKRITKGYYSIYEDTALAVFCFKPCYIGLQDALSIHNLWEQETNPVIVTVRKVRIGLRRVFGSNVFLRRIDKKYFFGFEYVKHDGFYVPVSDVEKTFIDLVYFRQNLDKDLLLNLKRKINKKKIKKYLARYPKRFRKKFNI